MRYALLFLLFIIKVSCDESSKQFYIQMRIVGGKPCPIKKYPFIISIHLRNKTSTTTYSPYCAGTLLNSKWILSAAHCYTKDKNNNISDYLAVGGMDKLVNFNGSHIQKSKLLNIVTKDYDPEMHNNDIALLELTTPMNETNTVKFVNLPLKSIFPLDISELYGKCTTAGWGVVIPISVLGIRRPLRKQDYPDELMCIDLPIIHFNRCQSIFHKKGTEIILSKTQMCTLYEKGRRDSCIGDSGGPLLCGGKQYGITSWGLGCAQRGYPGVFTRTDEYVNWIRGITSEGSSRKPLEYRNISKKLRSCQMQTHNFLRTLKMPLILIFLLVLYANFG